LELLLLTLLQLLQLLQHPIPLLILLRKGPNITIPSQFNT
jgi:hypothetical protein